MIVVVYETMVSLEGVTFKARQPFEIGGPKYRLELTATLPPWTEIYIGSEVEVDLSDPTTGVKIYDRRKGMN